MHVCLCSCLSLRVSLWRPENNSGITLRSTIHLVWNGIFYWRVAHQLGWTSQAANLRDPPISCATTPDVFPMGSRDPTQLIVFSKQALHHLSCLSSPRCFFPRLMLAPGSSGFSIL